MLRLHELIEKRANAVAAMRALSDLAERETRDLTADEDKRFGEIKAEITALDKKIERARDLETFERAAPATISRRGDGRYEERAREFSICRAIAAQLRDSNVDAGMERELSQEVARRTGRSFQGIAVPDEVFLAERRTLTVGSAAADLVPNVHRADLFIDRLRSSLITGQLGATVLDGLMGTVDIPKQTGSSAAQWLAEETSLTETDASFADVNLTPKTVGCMTSFSRRTLINAAPSIEQLVRNDLAAVIANAIDKEAMTGPGTGNKPSGIITVGTELTLADPTWAQVLAMIAGIQHADAAGGSLGWALNAHAVKKLRSTLKVDADAGAGFIMDQPGQLAGYGAAVTSALPGNPTGPVAATAIFGEWSSLLVGYWSGTDILVNPYETTAYAKGRVLVRAMRDCDVAVRHAEAFTFADDMPVT